MPIVDGQYQAKISTVFATKAEGVKQLKDKILQVGTMEYDKCVKCMKGTFDMAWRYADKQK